MSTKVVIGHIKVVDDEGNVLDAGISLTDLSNTFKHILTEMEKINIHLACITELHPSSSDTLNGDDI